MKECFIKHPVLALLIVCRICTMVEVVVRGDRPSIDLGCVGNYFARKLEEEEEETKEPMGFHIRKVEG